MLVLQRVAPARHLANMQGLINGCNILIFDKEMGEYFVESLFDFVFCIIILSTPSFFDLRMLSSVTPVFPFSILSKVALTLLWVKLKHIALTNPSSV